MTEIWNKKNFDKVEQYVHPEYTIHLDTTDPWEGKTLSHSEFEERLNFSFKSINTKGLTIYHFKDNLINGHTQVFDRITVMKQLGFM